MSAATSAGMRLTDEQRQDPEFMMQFMHSQDVDPRARTRRRQPHFQCALIRMSAHEIESSRFRNAAA